MSTADAKEEDDKADTNSPTDSATNTMLIPEKGDVKMAGYLEKRGKMKILSTWKRYWFVLEGRLLLYYRSQLEYLNLSACRGSLNMGIASCVRPVSGPGFVMEVVTRTHVITLRTKDRAVQEQWLQALLDSMALPNISSPMRNNGGPLHFRYSMDNLPTTDEMEQLDNEVRDKQGTLPRQLRPPSRQECVLSRIKNLGGHSYGANLDAILNRQSANQIQQPKIPRIKAVDRMLELQARDIEQVPSDTEDSENITSPNKRESKIKSDKPKMSSEEQNSTQTSAEQGEPLLREKLEGSHYSELQVSEMELQASSVKETAERTSSDCDPRVQSSSLTETSNMKISSESNSEVGTSDDVKEEIIKEKDTEQSSNITPQYVEVENLLYIKSLEESAGGKSCEFMDGISQQSKTVADTTISKGIEISAVDEDEYYSNYDKASVMANNENINIVSEPALPPRPSVSSPDSRDEVEYVEYNTYYEPEVLSEPSSPRTEGEKKKKKFKLRREKSSKDLITSENRSNHKNRKMSFLRKMLKHYRKKAEHAEEGDDEPEYDTVDYASLSTGSKDAKLTDSRQEEELSRRKTIGTAALLTKSALQELELKLKEREHGSIKQVTEDNKEHVFDETEKITTSNSLAEERSSMNDCKHLDSRNDVLPSDNEERPQLPPRRTRRPSSPWHDIPTNNSPVYGNFNFHSISSSENKRNEDNLVWSQEMQDELLGTPQGYSYLQNKWKAAEGSGEWHRELRQVAFPVNTRNQGPKLLNTNETEHIVHHDHSDGNVFKTESSFRNKEEDSVHVDSTDMYSNIDKILSEMMDNSTKEEVKEGSKDFSEQGVINVTKRERKTSEVCIVENVNYMSYNLNSNIPLLTLQMEMSRDENFQKDSLMTSLCTQAESEIDDSIISINPSESKKQNSEFDHENVIVLSKDENYLRAKQDCSIYSEWKCDKNITFNEIPSLKDMEAKSNPDNVLSEETKEVTNRYSDELNRLLAQLAEITSAPLLSPGATKSLTDFPESKTSHFHDLSLSDQITLLGPIRRRRHSEPDYDIPRPHNSIMQIKSFPTAPIHLPYVSVDQDKNIIETARFLEPSLPEEPAETSSVNDTDQTHLSWTLSMAPDSLEPIPVKYLETLNKPTS